MRSCAWLELQRGVLAITHGRYADARKHYQRADEAYPGHWQTGEHMAELLAAEGCFEEAAALFQKVIARVPKPELQQALGELYVLSGQPGRADPWFAKALATYLESVERGDVHYFHHLADFYTDAVQEPAQAVRFARMDVAMRSNFSTQSALAWALHLNGQGAEAIEHIHLALSSGVQDAGIFGTAATILDAAGDVAASRRYAEAALEINPEHRNFHLHHH
jgi:tetratricopeptide (TPR) repeat protein